MARYQAKFGKIGFGWEAAFRSPVTTLDVAATTTSQIDFIIRTKEFDITEGKPAMERDQPWHVGNATRLPTYTQEGEKKAGTLSIGDNLYDGHAIAMALNDANSGTFAITTGYVASTVIPDAGLAVYDFSSTTKNMLISYNGGTAATITLTATCADSDAIKTALLAAINNVATPWGAGIFAINNATTSSWFHLSTVSNTGYFTLYPATAASSPFTILGWDEGYYGYAPPVRHLSIGDRANFFAYFEKGTAAGSGAGSSALQLVGCTGDSISLSGKMNSFITFEVSAMTAKKLSSATITMPTDVPSVTTKTAYHWKHAAVNLKIGNVSYTTLTANQVESFDISIKNNTEYKHGAPATGGQANANWYKEGMIDAEFSLDLYPETTVLWDLGPNELEYQDHAASTIDLVITLDRGYTSTTNKIVFNATDLVITSISDKIPTITDGVTPISIKLKPAQYTSSIYFDIYEVGGGYPV